MAKKNATATEKMNELLAEQHQINNGYNNALQTAQEEYNQLDKEFQEIEAQARETHKKYVLGTASNDDYLAVKKQLKDADEKLRDSGYKLDEINTYRKEDLMELLTKLEANSADYAKEKMESEKALRYKALKAKFDYLNALHEFAKEHKEVWKVSRKVEDLRVELGLKNYNYISYDSVFTSLFSNSFDGTQGIDITQNELRQVFLNGTFDKRFIDELEKGKKLGLI